MKRIALVAFALSCSRLTGEHGPDPQAVVPHGAYFGSAVDVRVLGTGFALRGVHQLHGGGMVATDFAVRIGTRELPATLTDPQNGLEALSVSVPGDLPPGLYDVAVRDPYGLWGSLPAAFTVSQRAPPRLSATLAAPQRLEIADQAWASLSVRNDGEGSATLTGLGGGALDVPLQLLPGASFVTPIRLTPGQGRQTITVTLLARDDFTGLSLEPVTASASVRWVLPPALQLRVRPLAATVDVGQTFEVVVDVSNAGEVDALAVGVNLVFRPPLDSSTLISTDIPAGATRTFVFAPRVSASGLASADVSASATDALTEARIELPPSPTGTILVQQPAALSIRSTLAPAVVSRGQSFTVSAMVDDPGEANAGALSATLSLASTPAGGPHATCTKGGAPGSIDGGSTQSFDWSCVEDGSGAGQLGLTLTISGVDENSIAPISTGPVPLSPIAVQAAAGLSVSGWSFPGTLSNGQSFSLQVTATNSGQALATGVMPDAPVPVRTGQADAACTATSPAVDIAGGQMATFSWSCHETGTGSGTLAFSGQVAGSDGNSGVSVRSAGSTSAAHAVQSRAALASALAGPSNAIAGETVTISFRINDTGDAPAAGVTPGTLALSGSGSGVVAGAVTPSSATIAGKGTQLFTWKVTVGGPGTLRLDASATGTDGNDGGPLSTAAGVSIAVAPQGTQPESTLLTPSDPFGGDGTSSASIFSYQGMVYLGPDYASTSSSPGNTQSGVVMMAPDGTNQKSAPWQLEVYVNSKNGARNGAYQGTGVLCHTIGFAGCTSGTAQCGPDGENGRGLFASGVIAGTEWYLVSGSSPLGGARYLYMTTPSFPLAPGGYDDLAYVQIQAVQQGSTRQMTAARVFQDAVYLGFLDTNANGAPGKLNAPVLNVLKKTPSLPGLVAAAGTDIVDLLAVNMPAIGAYGGNAGFNQLMIDSLTDFGGALYLANNGGIARSVGAVTPCTTTPCSNWVDATPAGWGGRMSVQPNNATIGAIAPGQRAVPAMVPFGGRLFAARNTTNGPQLWSCNPSSGTPAQCLPADWMLAAPNVSGDNLLTQFNSSSNIALTLLVATASHLYVGFNSSSGVRIFRTANPAASQIADFTGRSGCTAGSAGCDGIGGPGLTSPPVTQIFDAHAFSYSGAEWVYVSAGDGSGGPRIFRLAP